MDNKNNIDFKSKYIVISNHQSFIDILITFALLPINLSFFTKKELFLIPGFGWALKAAGMIPVNRYDKKKSKESVLTASKKINSTELSILNYPEGTRTEFGQLGVFKKGGFILALNSNIPILPLTIVYNEKNITNKIRLVVGNVIETVNYNIDQRDILINKTKEIIKIPLDN
jgi:1-acyl-sn-glycerol-3-phosphate acyltransferase